jgi:uncharacterized protein (TIGR02300 family)
VVKAEWGSKRTCHSCGARFYDLRRDRIICPVCGAAYDPDRQPRPRRPGPAIKEEPTLPPRVVGDDIAVESLEEDMAEADAAETDLEDLDNPHTTDSNDDEITKEDGELMEDTSELGEDDDDIGEVMEHVDNELDDKA